MFECCFLFIYLFLTIFIRLIISKSTEPIFAKFGRTMTIDDQSEISFSTTEGRCHGNQILLVLVHECRETQASSGAAGRAKRLALPRI